MATKTSLAPLILLLVLGGRVGATSNRFQFTCPSPSASSCSSSSSQDQRLPLYVLVLVPFPDERSEAGWDYGLEMLPGARIARDFINCNQSDLLPGYRIELIESNHEACGISETIQETYINVARFALHKECGPVVVVAGLSCSPSTAIASQVAGHNGTDIIQLASSGSPAFDKDIEDNFTTYPRLWRYVSSAAIYVDTLLALMYKFGWRKVGLVYDLESFYFTSVAETFRIELAARNSQGFELISSSGLEQTDPQFLDMAVQNIKNTGVRIIFSATTYAQSTLLICRAAADGLIYPRYKWVFVDMYIQDFEDQKPVECSRYMLGRGLNSSFLLQYKLQSTELDVVKVTGGEIHGYFNLYQKHFRDVQREFNFAGNLTLESAIAYGHLLFDQIWSFAHALNRSLPLLERNNLSLSNYSAGSTMIADIIEEQLSQLNLQGVSSEIYFNRIRVVPSTVRVVNPEIVNVTSSRRVVVAIYMNTSLLNTTLTASDVPPDTGEAQLVTLHVAALAVIYMVITTAFILVTVVLVSFLFYRGKPAIKAASPYLSLFIFAGCYLLCLAALLRITYAGFGGTSITGLAYAFLCATELIVDQNGYSFILATLFIKLLRVHHIFTNKYLRNLSNVWKNSSLAFIVIILCLVPNISSIVIIFTLKPTYNSSVIPLPDIKDENGVRLERTIISCNIQNDLWYTISYLPLLIYLFMITYLAITMRRIKNRNFKDTKKVNIFVAIVAVLTVVYLFAWWLLLATHQKQYVAIIQTIFPLTVAVLCQLILFAPKVLPTFWSESKVSQYLSSAAQYNVSNEKSRKTSATVLLD